MRRNIQLQSISYTTFGQKLDKCLLQPEHRDFEAVLDPQAPISPSRHGLLSYIATSFQRDYSLPGFFTFKAPGPVKSDSRVELHRHVITQSTKSPI